MPGLENVDALDVVVADAKKGDSNALTTLMRQNNQRLYRIARSILRNDMEAEDVVQEVFIKAFTNFDTLRDANSLRAWLARVTVNMSITRLRQMKRNENAFEPVESTDALNDDIIIAASRAVQSLQIDPEQFAAIREVRVLIEQEIDKLPDGFREVFVLREVEQMSIQETAGALNIRPETVKTRLHRAKSQLREGLNDHFDAACLKAFPFAGEFCERTTRTVLQRLQELKVIDVR